MSGGRLLKVVDSYAKGMFSTQTTAVDMNKIREERDRTFLTARRSWMGAEGASRNAMMPLDKGAMKVFAVRETGICWPGK